MNQVFRKSAWIGIVCLFVMTDICFAGKNITSKTGMISNLSNSDGASPSVSVSLYPPETGRNYVVKVNFLKLETSAKALDAYFDSVNKNSNEKGSLTMDALRETAKNVTSKANVTVVDSAGNKIGGVSDLGAVTFGKKVKFRAGDSAYRAVIECSQGAGLYHLVFEYK